MEILIVLSCILVCCVFIYIFIGKNKMKNTLPGPKGCALFGNTFEVDRNRLHLTLTEWAKIYGDIYGIYLCGKSIVVLNSADIARRVLLKEPNATLFADRVPSFLGKQFTHECVGIGLSPYHDAWIKRRKIGHRILKAYGEGMRMKEESVQTELRSIVGNLKGLEEQSFDPEEIISGFLGVIITILLTGKRYERTNEWPKTILKYNESLNKLFTPGTDFISDWLPFVRFIPGHIRTLYLTAKHYQKKFESLIKAERKLGRPQGMIYELYEEMNNQKLEDQWLTDQSVLAILGDMVFAGLITSQGMLWSAIRILLHRRDVQIRLQNEVDEAVGQDRDPSLADRVNMPYTQAFIFETLRYITHAPLAIPHRVSDDTTIDGYNIAKGSIVLLNLWSIHHNPDIYPEPDEFKPERFLDSEGKLQPPNESQRRSFLAFSLGKRSCIGESFAKSRIFFFISTMMQHFSFVPESGDVPMFDPCQDMEPSIARTPKAFRCRAKLRQKLAFTTE